MYQKNNQFSCERKKLNDIIYELWLADESREEDFLTKIAGLSDIQASYILSQIQIEHLYDNPEKIDAIITHTKKYVYKFISDTSYSIH